MILESISKQHEAMKRALQLAERNKQLEKELRDIDQIALAVEADCNSAVKINSDKVAEVQEKLSEREMRIEDLERQLNDFKRKKKILESDLDAVSDEKENFQKIVQTAFEDKKRLTDKISQLGKIGIT